jgi:hypothetical protein
MGAGFPAGLAAGAGGGVGADCQLAEALDFEGEEPVWTGGHATAAAGTAEGIDGGRFAARGHRPTLRGEEEAGASLPG